jgi:ABC-type thiamine transport system substrate-binding protein
MKTIQAIKQAIREARITKFESYDGYIDIQLQHDKLPLITMQTYLSFFGDTETHMWVENEFAQRMGIECEYTKLDDLAAFILGIMNIEIYSTMFSDDMKRAHANGLRAYENI